MRLIDADALLKALKANCGTLCNDKNTDWCEYCCPHNDFEDLIDNAPTIERPQDKRINKIIEELESRKDYGVEYGQAMEDVIVILKAQFDMDKGEEE